MAPRIGIRLIAAALLTVAGIYLMTPSISFAADSSSEGLIAADPLPGYTVEEGGPFTGAIDEGTMMVLGGLDPADVPDQAHALSGQARTWVSDAGDHAVILVFDCGDVPTASNVLAGGVDRTTKVSDSTFDPGFAGSAGFTSKPQSASTTLYTVIWRQGTYFVETFIVAAHGGIPDAKALAASEASFLRSSTGAVPAASVASTSSAGEDSSIAYQAGRLTGTLLLVGSVIFLIRNGKRRRDEREAYKARMATPPPAFPMRPPTGVPADGSAWARVPPPPPPPPA